MSKIGIFGGSFDPIHAGHIYLAELAKKAADLKEVWFMPCHVSPHKCDSPPSPSALRLQCLELALAEIPWARCEPLELQADQASFSYLSLQILAARHPGVEWHWIMGGDQWTALPKWRHPEILASLATFIVMSRNGLEISPRQGYRMIHISGSHPASSTQIRKDLAAKSSEIPHLPPAIRHILQK